MSDTARRRRLLVAALLAGGIGPVLAATPTPRQTTGPFYPDTELPDDDADLTRVRGVDGIADGEITELSGRVVDVDGRPLAASRVEIWQCDANGRYRHSRERGARAIDPRFQGFGQVIADADGGYRFRTIRPVAYPGRTPHIHVQVITRRGLRLVTQLYVRGEPANARDFLFQQLGSAGQQAASADFVADADGIQRARFDIVLAAAQRDG